MKPYRPQRRHVIVFTLVTIVSLFFIASSIGATAGARVHSKSMVTAAEWRAVATLQNATPVNQALILTWSVSRGTAYQYLDIVNSGTIDLTGQTFHVSSILDRGGNTKSPTVTFEACLSGTWVAPNSCTGTVVALGSTATEIFTTTNTPLAVAGRLHLQATTVPSGAYSYTTTVNISVNRIQVRPGSTVFA